MNALLLAAGYGTRLRPFTATTPKCLMPIRGQPLLGIWLERLFEYGIEKCLVNTHYLPEQVKEYVGKSQFRKSVSLIYEPKLLGTAGTLLLNIDFFEGRDGIFVHADNYCLADFAKFEKAHKNRPKECVLTMMTFRTERPNECGIVEIDERGVVINFHEKKENPPGNLANGAIYMLSNKFLIEFSEAHKKSQCFSTEILPKYLGKIYTYETDSTLIDIGTTESYVKINN